MSIIRWSGCSGMFHFPGVIDCLNEMYCYRDLIISHHYKILVIYTQFYSCLVIGRKCTLIEVRFTSAYCVFWTCFVSFVTAGFMKLNDNSEENFGTGILLYFERQRKLPKRTNSKILFLLILVIRKIP